MGPIQRIPVDRYLDAPASPKPSAWARFVRGETDADAVLRAIVARALERWPDARVALLWDKDLCVFTDRGILITDVRPGSAPATSTVTIIPRTSITRVVRTEQTDPTRKVGDLDPAARARAAGFASGFASEISDLRGVWPMALAYLGNQQMRAGEEPLVWQRVSIETDNPELDAIVLEFCHQRDAAYDVSATLGGN